MKILYQLISDGVKGSSKKEVIVSALEYLSVSLHY